MADTVSSNLPPIYDIPTVRAGVADLPDPHQPDHRARGQVSHFNIELQAAGNGRRGRAYRGCRRRSAHAAR